VLQLQRWMASHPTRATFVSRPVRTASQVALLFLSIALWSWPGVALANDHSIVTLWDGATFLLPTELPIGYGFVDTADPEDAILAGGVLTMATSQDSEVMYYFQSGAQITMPDDLVIEARMRLVSGSSVVAYRAPAMIMFTTAPTIGNALFIGIDQVFLLSGNTTVGDTALVDTNDSFHTYRIEVSGGAITVYQDAVQILTGSTFSDVSANGNGRRVLWGIASINSYGAAEWQTFEHNASPPIINATWHEARAIQAHDGGIHPALLVGLAPQAATPIVTTPDASTIVMTYGGLSPNEEIQLNLAGFGNLFYPPDDIHPIGNRIEVDFVDSGTMFTLAIAISSTSGELVDPGAIVGFNPQPEPPAGSIYAFNPQPEPPAGDPLSIFIPLSGGAGAPGSTQISLTIEVLDQNEVALPVNHVPPKGLPALGGFAQVVLGCLLVATAIRTRGKAAN
jgi:hypothetical protein